VESAGGYGFDDADDRSLKMLIGHISVDNRPMLRSARERGFWIAREFEDTSTCVATLEIDSKPKIAKSRFSRWFRH